MDNIEEVEKDSKLRKLEELRKKAIAKLGNIRTQLEILTEDEKVKSYIEQSTIASALEKELPRLNLEIIQEKMINCDHIWITSEINRVWDGHRTDKYEYHSCVKCGLDTRARERVYARTLSMNLERIMNSVLRKPSNGVRTNIICQYNLAKGIYDGIVRAHPNITDELAVKYMEHALHNIRNNEVSAGVKEKRSKRLNLRPNFNKWDALDIVSRDN